MIAFPLPVASYLEQTERWPQSGQSILAHFDEESIIVYQAYRPGIGQHALKHGVFGGDFKYSRMSWIKPNFLWMMYRSNWGQAEGQEVVLAIRLKRIFFDSLLDDAVISSYDPNAFGTTEAWAAAVARSDVRCQWDPDHRPNGSKCERRAIQLGLRGNTLERYGRQEILEIIDMSPFVAMQREILASGDLSQLMTPIERVYERS